MVARAQGLSVAICDPTPHPRFVIGESATPAVGQLIAALADEFDLPDLLPMTSHADWTAAHPDVVCGRKRGFCYVDGAFLLGEETEPQPLLVAASSSNAVSDLHWKRADIDRWLLSRAVRRGTRLIAAHPIAEAYKDGHWRFVFEAREPVRSRSLLDASGTLSARTRQERGIESFSAATGENPFTYESSLLYTHASDAAPVATRLPDRDWAFAPDDAAVHGLFEDGWSWQFRFDDGSLSVGLECDRFGHDAEDNLVDRFRRVYSRLAPDPGRWISRPRGSVQRILSSAGSEGLAMLPHAFGFVSPLHSTGLMATVQAIPLAIEALLSQNSGETLTGRYRNLLHTVDRLAVLAREARRFPQAHEAAVMHYVAAAINGERQSSFDRTRPLLLSSDPAFREQLDDAIARAQRITTSAAAGAFFEWSGQALAAFCPSTTTTGVSLCDPAADRNYRQTAAR